MPHIYLDHFAFLFLEECLALIASLHLHQTSRHNSTYFSVARLIFPLFIVLMVIIVIEIKVFFVFLFVVSEERIVI